MPTARKTDFTLLMDEEISSINAEGGRPKLLLHLCCAPCSSHVIELLDLHFELVLYFYDPNIHPYSEYRRRMGEAKRHAEFMNLDFIEGPYDVERWHDITRGHEKDPEKGERCRICYDMRLAGAARLAKEIGCEYFTTVLSISPHKDPERINETGYRLSERFGVKYLPADFKKRDGFKKSIELSKRYGFYRQSYCGCVYSKR